MMLAAEMVLPESAGFAPLFMILRLLFGVLFVVVPVGAVIYAVVLLRRLTAAVLRIEQRLATTPDTSAPSPMS